MCAISAASAAAALALSSPEGPPFVNANNLSIEAAQCAAIAFVSNAEAAARVVASGGGIFGMARN
jgi:hypothetical protein